MRFYFLEMSLDFAVYVLLMLLFFIVLLVFSASFLSTFNSPLMLLQASYLLLVWEDKRGSYPFDT